MSEDATVKFNDAQWRAFLKKIGTNIDTRKLEPVAKVHAFQDVIDHFKFESGPSGRWKSWSDSYRKQMEGKGKAGNNILQDSGRLKNGFKLTNKSKISKGSISWYNNQKTKRSKKKKGGFPYAHAHDTGGPQLPKRSFAWLSNSALDRIANDYLQYLMEKSK